MRLAIIGAGNIGTTIGGRWQQSGHDIVYGVRDPGAERYRDLAGETEMTDTGQAIRDADAVLIAIPGEAVPNLLDAHAPGLNGKLVIDASNNVSGQSFHHIPLFEERVPNARVYRAFNTLGWENFADPDFGGERADLLYSGPEGDDRATVEGLITDVGLRPAYVGAGSQGADLLDGVTRLWFALALQRRHGRHLAFKTLGLSSSFTAPARSSM